MKKAIVFLLGLFVAMGVAGNVSAQKKEKSETAVFQTNIHCESCAKRIESSLPFEKGVTDLSVDVPAKRVTVVFNPAKTDVQKLQKAIEKLGYTAELVKPEQDKPQNKK